jgi:uncharacterized membrane protein
MAANDQHATGTLVGISFPTTFRAQEFLTAVTGLAAREKLVLMDAVTIVKNADGKVLVQETIDPTPGRSALSGAMWIGLVGLVVGGPVAWVAGAAIGAGAGAITAKVVDIGISDEWVAWFREAVRPNTATLAILVDDFDRNALVAEAGRFPGAELVYTSLDELTLDRIKDALGQQTEVLHGDLSESADDQGERPADLSP